jgi:hypothetical protein
VNTRLRSASRGGDRPFHPHGYFRRFASASALLFRRPPRDFRGTSSADGAVPVRRSAFGIFRHFLSSFAHEGLQHDRYAEAENEAPKVESIRGREFVRRPESVRSAVTEIGSAVIYKERLQVEGDRGTEQLLEFLVTPFALLVSSVIFPDHQGKYREFCRFETILS